jgi:hypothetical protein
MAHRHKGKCLALAALFLAVALASFTIMQWETLATNYQLYRLRSDSSLLDTIIENPGSTRERLATKQFLRTISGSERFFETFIGRFNTDNIEGWDPPLGTIEKGIIGLKPLGNAKEECTFWFHLEYPNLTVETPQRGAWDHPHPGILQSLLPEVAGRAVKVSKYPHLRFEVLPLKEAMKASNPPDSFVPPPETTPWACILWQEPSP